MLVKTSAICITAAVVVGRPVSGESWENHYIAVDYEAGPLAPPTPTRSSSKFTWYHISDSHAHCTATTTARRRHYKHPPAKNIDVKYN